MSDLPKTVVSLIDKTDGPLHKSQEVWINGQRVHVVKGSVRISHGYDEYTKVTLTLPVDELHFEHETDALERSSTHSAV